jgi:hypothetical protein
MMFLFSSIKYTLGTSEIETVNFPGQATTMFWYASQPRSANPDLSKCCVKDEGSSNKMANALIKFMAADDDAALADYRPQDNEAYNEGAVQRLKYLIRADVPSSWHFNFEIPLSHIFGFCDDYKKAIYGITHTLTLTRKHNNDALMRLNTVDNGKVILSSIKWYIPEATLRPDVEISLIHQFINPITIPIAFRERHMQQTQAIAGQRELNWTFTMTKAISPVQYILVALQTEGDPQIEMKTLFEVMKNLTEAYVTIDGETYPQTHFESDHHRGIFVRLYREYKKFRQNYYKTCDQTCEPMLTYMEFINTKGIVVFDTRHQPAKNEAATTIITINLKFSVDFRPNTRGYALVLSDKILSMKMADKLVSNIS